VLFYLDFDFLNMIMLIKYLRRMGNTLKIIETKSIFENPAIFISHTLQIY